MRKSLFVLALLVAAIGYSGVAEAQQAGIKFGRIWSEFDGETGDPETTFGRRANWTAGLWLRFDMGAISLQPEALYTRRGANVEGVPIGESWFETTYLEVPILLRLGGDSAGIYAGGYGALKLDAKAVEEAAGVRNDLDISDQVEDFDYGLVFGVGFGLGGVDIEGRYTMGMAELFTDPAAPEIKHRAITVLASFGF